MAAKEEQPVHLKRVTKRDIEQILENTVGKKYGDRFANYRAEYNRLLAGERIEDVPLFPMTLTIETVNRCNLACVMCHLPHFEKDKETLTEEQIEKILGDAEKMGVPAVIIGNGHEPLLYKDVDNFIDDAVKHKMMDLLLFTNGVLLTKNRVEKILNSGITRVFVSLDAATEETYNKIRRSRAATNEPKGRLAQVEANIHHLIQRRNELNRELPIVRVSFVMQRENAHEIATFKEKWVDVVDAVDFQRMSLFSSIETIEMLSDEERWKPRPPSNQVMRLNEKERFCHHPFDTLAVWSDGNVGPCCAYQGKNLVLGNINETTLEEIWNGERLKTLRSQHLDGNLNIVCQDCLGLCDFSFMNGADGLK